MEAKYPSDLTDEQWQKIRAHTRLLGFRRLLEPNGVRFPQLHEPHSAACSLSQRIHDDVYPKKSRRRND